MKQPEPDNCMTYVQGVTDTTPKPLTRQRLEALLDSEQTRELVQRCRAEKDENRQNRIKAMLPAVMFNGLFSQQNSARYMTSPTRTKPTLRDAPNYIPSGLYGVDIDEDCNPRELFRKAGMAIKERLRIQPAQVVAMAYESPRRGLRLVVKRQRGLTIAQEQERWDRLLGLPCDKKCKDLGRLYFLTSREQLIYYNPELLFPSTPPAKEDFPPGRGHCHARHRNTGADHRQTDTGRHRQAPTPGTGHHPLRRHTPGRHRGGTATHRGGRRGHAGQPQRTGL